MNFITLAVSVFSKIAFSGGIQGGLIRSVVAFVNMQSGGLAGLVQLFHKAGVEDIVASWIGKGANLAIDSPTLQKVLGNASIDALAQKAGISADDVGGILSKVLPRLVDKATPLGELPADGKLNVGMVVSVIGVVSRLFAKHPSV